MNFFAHLILIVSLSALCSPSISKGQAKSCAALFAKEGFFSKISGASKIKTLFSRLPNFYIDPIPRVVKNIDHNLIDTKVEDYFRLFSEGRQNELSNKIQTNEEKIAYLEATEIYARSNLSNSVNKSLVNRMRIDNEKQLLKFVSKWKAGKPISRAIF